MNDDDTEVTKSIQFWMKIEAWTLQKNYAKRDKVTSEKFI